MSTNGIKTSRTANTVAGIFLSSVFLVLFATACGQRGPLYLPKQDAGATPDAAARADEKPETPAGGADTMGDEEDGDEETP